ncbi:hypothetical protein FPK46_37810, partial [Acinetobacter baumannii]|nr:hypothetical protein [Acinetobacter baumannii]
MADTAEDIDTMIKIRSTRVLATALAAAALCAGIALTTTNRASAKEEKAPPRPALSVTTARPATASL